MANFSINSSAEGVDLNISIVKKCYNISEVKQFINIVEMQSLPLSTNTNTTIIGCIGNGHFWLCATLQYLVKSLYKASNWKKQWW